MAVSDVEIGQALDAMVANEVGFPFQKLAIMLAHQTWPDLVASEPKNDLGADAEAGASLSQAGEGKVLACSLTATLAKVKDDATKIKTNFPDTKVLIFATPKPVSKQKEQHWAKELQASFGMDLVVMSRSHLILKLADPANLLLCRTFLHMDVEIEPDVQDLIQRARRASSEITTAWAAHRRVAEHPLLELRMATFMTDGQQGERFSWAQLCEELGVGRRCVLEAPAGRGKTTTLIQLARKVVEDDGIAILIDLPEWAKSDKSLLDFLADMPQFRTNAIDAKGLARLTQAEPLRLLFNGWNELSDSSTERIEDRLRSVDRDWQTAGVVVATRRHSIRPPLSGATRIGLLSLLRSERLGYLVSALGDSAQQLENTLASNSALDELTRTPFILREIVKIHLAGRDLPTSKMGILEAVVALLEESSEHQNELHRIPLDGNAEAYLLALAIHMTSVGDTAISETEARRACTAVSRSLAVDGQVAGILSPTTILDALCRHHILEMTDYPATAFRFEHQQFQEFYAALSLERELTITLQKGPTESKRYVEAYLNPSTWTEPLQMVAERIGSRSGQDDSEIDAVARGVKLVEMALDVDPIFASNLARLSGPTVWKASGAKLGTRVRAWYQVPDEHHKECALAAMLASGSADFIDVVLPLLTHESSQVRMTTYRGCTEFHLSILGPDWKTTVAGWSEDVRQDFVSELTVHHGRTDIAEYFALTDVSVKVRVEATKYLSWMGAREATLRAFRSLPEAACADALLQFDREDIPTEMRESAFLAYESRLSSTDDPLQRIRLFLGQYEFGEVDILQSLKSELTNLQNPNLDYYGQSVPQTALEMIGKSDPSWVGAWVAARIKSGLPVQQAWLSFVKPISDSLTEELLAKLSSEDMKHGEQRLISVLSTLANSELALKVFLELCSLRRSLDEEKTVYDDPRHAIVRQLEALFRLIPGTTAVTGLFPTLSGAFDRVQLIVAVGLLSGVGRDESDLREELPTELREKLRSYLKSAVAFACSEDDPIGRTLADLGSSLARVGRSDDLTDLAALIHADIARFGKVRKAVANGNRQHGLTGWFDWHVRAVIALDRETADTVLLSLLTEDEYQLAAAHGLLSLATEAQPRFSGFPAEKNYDLIWEARRGARKANLCEERRKRYSQALHECVSLLLTKAETTGGLDDHSHKIQKLAAILAALNGQASADLIFKAVSLRSRWNGWSRIGALEKVLFDGGIVPVSLVIEVLDQIFDEVGKHGFHSNDQNLGLVKFGLGLLSFVDDPVAGIAYIKNLISVGKFPRYELGSVFTALGHSRCPEALTFLREIAGDDAKGITANMERSWLAAVGRLGGAVSDDMLIAFLDPPQGGFSPQIKLNSYDAELLASMIAAVILSDPARKARALMLVEEQLTPERSFLLVKVITSLGTAEAALAGLRMGCGVPWQPVPYEILKMFEALFLQHNPVAGSSNSYTIAPKAANPLRAILFEWCLSDTQEGQRAFAFLGQIEAWRLEHGKPSGEPRHPALHFGIPWPPPERLR